MFAWQAWSARRRADRIWYGAQAASSFLTAAGAISAGTDLIALGAGTAEVPPLGAALMLTGVLVLAGACVYREWDWLGGRLRAGAAAAGRALRGAAGAARSGLGWARDTGAHAAGAALDAGRALASSLNPF